LSQVVLQVAQHLVAVAAQVEFHSKLVEVLLVQLIAL
jgi:hypothetical protein